MNIHDFTSYFGVITFAGLMTLFSGRFETVIKNIFFKDIDKLVSSLNKKVASISGLIEMFRSNTKLKQIFANPRDIDDILKPRIKLITEFQRDVKRKIDSIYLRISHLEYNPNFKILSLLSSIYCFILLITTSILKYNLEISDITACIFYETLLYVNITYFISLISLFILDIVNNKNNNKPGLFLAIFVIILFIVLFTFHFVGNKNAQSCEFIIKSNKAFFSHQIISIVSAFLLPILHFLLYFFKNSLGFRNINVKCNQQVKEIDEGIRKIHLETNTDTEMLSKFIDNIKIE